MVRPLQALKIDTRNAAAINRAAPGPARFSSGGMVT